MKTKWPTLFAWLFLAILILLFIGGTEFSWKITKILPLAIASLFLFFQFFTISRLNRVHYKRFNQILLAVQLFLLSGFVFGWIDIRAIWKLSMLILLIATHIYLLDMNTRFVQKRKTSKLILFSSLFISVISLILLPYFPFLMNIGISSIFIAGMIVLSNIFLFKKEQSDTI